MEVLAGVSSVLSVLGFAIQLADGIKKACALWESLQEAPHEVQMICKDLRAISNILDDIKIEENQFVHHSNSITEALGLCSEVLESLNHLSQKIVFPKTDTTLLIKRWRAMKGVIKIEKLQGLQSRLNSAKLTLVLARQNSSQAMDLAFSTLSNPTDRSGHTGPQKKSLLDDQEYSFSTIKTPFGTISLHTNTMLFADNTCKMRTDFIMHPSRLLQLCGVNLEIRISLLKSYGALKHELKAYRAVPNDAAIFMLCKEGRIDAIRYLFDAGLASPLDTDSFGRTPLMMAASAGNTSTCQFLVNEGADLEARDMQNNDLGSYACGTWWEGRGKNKIPSGAWSLATIDQAPCDDRLDAIRMFIEQFEVSEDPNSSGVIGLCHLADFSSQVANSPYRAEGDVFYWTAPFLQDQPILTSNLKDFFSLESSFAIELQDTRMSDYIFRSYLHDLPEDWFTSSVGLILAYAKRVSDLPFLFRCMTSHDIDLHKSFTLQCPVTYERQQSTITTILIQSSARFFSFKTTLQNLDINMAEFVCDEMQQSPVIAAGWAIQSLRAVFNLDYVPNESLPYFLCLHKCTDFPFKYGRELSWEILLDKLNAGSDFSSGVEDILREREEDVIKFQSVDGRVCSCCGKVGRSYATVEELIIEERRINWDEIYAEEDEAKEEDSMFLLSI
ncbi:hypothetical protein BELL_1002g00010 [Botrytis elliptica]|uniref:NACHT-NTPase and P-loop NTPases N-terminal domain-containing protein n=1 Tax=Botrytis elliptica TaxID=278938 RepID=A0A4Z1J1Z0_9HELO|nr:hypothetical protein BELL_1002g00010 [Botrytis elliptica]